MWKTSVEYSKIKPVHGKFFVFLGALPYTEKTVTMLRAAALRHEEGLRVYVCGMNPNLHAKSDEIESLLKKLGQSIDRVKEGVCLDSEETVDAIIEDKPSIVVVGNIIPANNKNINIEERKRRIKKLLGAGIHVYASVNVYNIEGVLEKFKTAPASLPSYVITRNKLLSAATIDVVDTSIYQSLKILRNTKMIKQYPFIEKNMKSFVNEENLEVLRQEALTIAVEHSKELQAFQEVDETLTKSTVHSLKETAKIPYLKLFMYDNFTAMAIVLLCTLVNFLVEYSVFFTLELKVLVYLTGVVAITLFTNFYTGLLGVVLSYLSYNFFFVPPIYQFSMYNFPDIATALVFAFCALLINVMTSVSHKKSLQKRTLRELESNILSDFLKDLMDVKSVDKVMETLSATLNDRILFQNTIVYNSGAEAEDKKEIGIPLEDKIKLNILEVLSDEKLTPNTRFEKNILPIKTHNKLWGVIVIHHINNRNQYELSQIIEGLCELAGRTIERLFLGGVVQETLIENEREQLRNALLSSISHDLKTPLVGIVGSLSTLKSYGDKLEKEEVDDLLQSSIHEAKRLSQFISNILEISKIESGSLNLKCSWQNVNDITFSVKSRFKMIPHEEIIIMNELESVEVYADPVLFGQTLFNLIDNAIKYAGIEKNVEVLVKKEKEYLTICVQDYGPGIDEKAMDNYFNKFYRHYHKDNQNAGTGLGLSICKGMMEAHHFSMDLYNRKDVHSGAVFEIKIPSEYVRDGESEDEHKH